ncbi:hypothetical protein DTO021D3_8001 [Paecilomyces variotii]|nr:hypothetical protein DTO032I3_7849 [Paecilomyces variotii]KAJ9275134.1 hypothetical protein DTO021D3_8001 [Paecilomyces variotii]KAJ9347222.1 hypothetical protein DTO027B6_96 [Paecilomyces variotii]KAJ9376922.1 hypothetical protein DTO032I4_8342 [Paecilomyces variotii]
MIHKTDERSATMQQTFSEKTCYEQGWLHSEPLDADAIDIVCVFPTRLNAKYVEHYLTASSVPFPIQRYPTIEDLAEAEVLGFSSNVSSEWLGDGDGRIDFRLADVAWGIELLRDGDRLHAHCSRFVNNGSYTPWIQKGWLRNWLIIDCRTSPPRPYNVPGTKIWMLCSRKIFRLWKS